MERYVEIVPGYENPEAFVVMLKVDHQSFRLEGESETRDDAEWMRDMLCIALDRLAQQERQR